MSQKRAETNGEWLATIDKIVEEAKKTVLQPNFVGHVSLELHASEGMIKTVVAGEKRHHSLARR